MEELKSLLKEQLTDKLIQIVLSGAKKPEEIQKMKIRPVLVNEQLLFQFSSFVGTKVLHENLDAEAAESRICEELTTHFKQMQLESRDKTATALVSKKGKLTLKQKKSNRAEEVSVDLSHNRKKKYILNEGEVVPFLVDLGVQTKDGKIVKAKYDKFRQINRFLEFLEDVVPKLPTDRTISIIDFGCGKSYLTFAMYYYLKVLRKYDIDVIGLDLKEDVIRHCNELKDKYGYEHLLFLQGDIKEYSEKEEVDMVVTLHACDTATDYALVKAAGWNAKVILSVPCCQHEVNKQIKNEMLAPILKYGILKERMSALITDGIRANLLEELGYDTQLLEFIDLEHTPKNILIRAVKSDKMRGKSDGLAKTEQLLEQIQVEQTFHTLLKKERVEE